ncbi:hypothetical protein [Parathalassolituus penaei]|uniref:Lipoprotein n=1 Tax=Parathalassolituus penaei TaxID=2997323 RepID=A0A9X3EB24_9GAMM|nr:hypothetical protein [Parathalassolituus penaei]MCY0964257.1 hypothetical protein [Parathalassolituus penaei]
MDLKQFGGRWLRRRVWLNVLLGCLLVSQACANDAEQQLNEIQSDLDRGRLSLPTGRNAMEKIDLYRQRWPADLRIVPFAYRWSAGQLAAAEHAYLYADYGRLQQLLEQLWWLTPEAPGLEAFQSRVDQDPRVAWPAVTDTPEQTVKALALDAYQPLAARISNVDPKAADRNVEILATQELDAERLQQRDKTLEETLQPFCKALIEHQADVRIETASRDDYSWLTVRLTLCARRFDPNFRVRHHYVQQTGTPRLQLYIPRPQAGSIFADGE